MSFYINKTTAFTIYIIAICFILSVRKRKTLYIVLPIIPISLSWNTKRLKQRRFTQIIDIIIYFLSIQALSL